MAEQDNGSMDDVKAAWWEKSASPSLQETRGGKFLNDPYEYDLDTVSVAARGADPEKIDVEFIEDDLLQYAEEDDVSAEDAQARIDALRRGAEPTEEELEIWQSFAENVEIFDLVAIYRGETPHGSVWWVSEESRGIAWEQMRSWGPYRSQADAKAKEQAIVSSWS